MLRIDKLSLYMKKDLRYLVKDFSFVPGEKRNKIALIGEEGNGKSTLLKAIYDPRLITDYVEITGEINHGGEVIGYLPQQISETDARKSTEEILVQEIAWENIDYTELNKLLFDFELNSEIISPELNFGQLSGGEKIKYQLILQLLKRPTLLLLDEPSNDLDLASIGFLEDFIKNSKLKIIFVSHDERLLENCSDTIVHFEQLVHKSRAVHTVASLNYKEYVRQRSAKIERQSKMAFKEREEFNAQMERYRKIYERVQHELRSVSRQEPEVARNLKDKMHTVKSIGRRFEKQEAKLTVKPIVEDAISIGFKAASDIHTKKALLAYETAELKAGPKILSRNIRLELCGPEKICIVGANGSGKTTLLREIHAELKNLNLSSAYMPQEYGEGMDMSKSPIDFLTRDYSKEEHTRIRTYLGSLKFTPEEMLRPIAELSGGQKAKLYFAKMILHDAEVLVLDEPTRNLSPLSGPEIREALLKFTGAIIAVSHDRAFIDEVFDKVYELRMDGLQLID
ncbi:MAG: ATP-binding cassette domain-containing protein [Eubacteriales bacterium]|nr:ATP-binding cassette domain-containing protein [Eubacteriales bacterium]